MQYLVRWRMLLPCDRLENVGGPISIVADDLGYESESAFGAAFNRVLGSSPREYMRRARMIEEAVLWSRIGDVPATCRSRAIVAAATPEQLGHRSFAVVFRKSDAGICAGALSPTMADFSGTLRTKSRMRSNRFSRDRENQSRATNCRRIRIWMAAKHIKAAVEMRLGSRSGEGPLYAFCIKCAPETIVVLGRVGRSAVESSCGAVALGALD